MADFRRKKPNEVITRVIHVETIGTKGEMLKKEIKAILKSQSFKKNYIPEVKLIPPYNARNQTRQIQTKIQQCILIQDQFCSQVTVGDLDLPSVDNSVSSQGNATIRELILKFKNIDDKPLFIGVERKWNNQGYSVLYPKVYMEEAMEIIKHLPFYLVRSYGGAIKKCFGTETQHIISMTVWNEKEQRAVSEEDAELLEAEMDHSTMTWFTFSPEAEKV